MSEETKQPAGTELLEVPTDINEYKKFVADGGVEHNAKIHGRAEAEKAAHDAGLTIAPENGHAKPARKKDSRFRIGQLQERIHERDRRIAELERAAAAAKPDTTAKPEATAKPDVKPDDKTPARPKESDFKTYSEFVEALTDWQTDRKLEAIEAKRAQAREAEQQAETQKRIDAVKAAHDARVDEAKTRYDDWREVFDGLDNDSFSDSMMVYIFESEKGPDISYYLATHRKELARIRELSVVKQVAALARLDDRLSEESEKPGDDAEPADNAADKAKEKGADKPKGKSGEDDDEDEEEDEPEAKKPAARRPTHSKAPPPIKPLGGRGGADDSMPDPSNFVAYEAWAKRQQAKGVKRTAV